MSEKLNSAKNNQGATAYQKYIASLIDQSQISNESEKGTDFEPIKEDPETPDYSVNPDSGTAYGADMQADPEPVIPESMKRFNIKHEPIDENEIKKGMGLKDVKSGGGTN